MFRSPDYQAVNADLKRRRAGWSDYEIEVAAAGRSAEVQAFRKSTTERKKRYTERRARTLAHIAALEEELEARLGCVVVRVVMRYRDPDGKIVDTWHEEVSEVLQKGDAYEHPKYGSCVVTQIAHSTSPMAVTVESAKSGD
jgi:hypothetical protein